MWLFLAAGADASPPSVPGAGPVGERLVDHPELLPSEVRVGTLPSGLRFVMEARHDRPRVGVAAFYPGGSGLDPVGREGAAHLAEHLWFRTVVGEGSVQSEIDAIGADRQGLTYADGTLFACTAEASELERLLALEEARVRWGLSGATAGQMEAERSIVAREREYRNHGGWPLFSRVFAGLFPPGDPSSRRIEATPASLAAVTVDDLAAAAGRWTPAGATLVLTGDLPATATLDAVLVRVAPTLVGATTAPLPLAPWPTATGAAPPPHPHDRRLAEVLGDTEEPVLAFAWSLPGTADADPVPHLLIQAVAQLLLQRALSDLGLPDDEATCELIAEARASTLLCTFSAADGFPEDLAPRVAAAFDALLFGDVNDPFDTLRQWAVSLAQAQTIRLQQGLADGSLWALLDTAAAWHRYGPRASPHELAVRYADLRTAEILEFSRLWLTRDRLVPVLLVPDPNADPDPLRLDARGEPLPPSTAASAPLPAVPDFSGLTEEVLQGGLRVIVVPAGGYPTVHATLSVRGGPDRLPPILQSLLLDVVSPFYADTDGSLWSRPLDDLGWWTWPRSGAPLRWGVVMPATRTREGLAALGQAVSNMEVRFDQDWRGAVRSHRVLTRRKTRTVAANDDVNELLLSRHPAGAPPVLHAPILFSAGSKASLRRAFSGVYRPENAALVVVGPVDPHEVIAWARESFGRWRGRGPAPPPPTPAELPVGPATRTIRLYPVEDRTTAKVTTECLLTSDSTGQERDLLAELAERELWRRLREEAGLTYAPSATVWDLGDRTATLAAQAPVAPGSAERALGEMLAMFAELASGAIDPGPFERARLAAARTWAHQLATRSGLSNTVAGLWEAGRPWSQLAGPGANGPSPERIAALLGRCVGHEVATVIGGGADVDAVARRWPEALTVRR